MPIASDLLLAEELPHLLAHRSLFPPHLLPTAFSLYAKPANA
jgi:hypothetical protein